MALKQIKSKIKATQRTSKVTKAMEAVSAVKMRKSQERALDGRAYASAAVRILERVSHTREAQAHDLFRDHGLGKHCFIVVTSDKGLAGSLNSAVLKEAYARVTAFEREAVELICFGKKSYEFFTRRGYTVAQHFLNIRDEIELHDLEAVTAFVTEAFKQERYASVHVIFQNFVSTFEQRALSRQVLPLRAESLAQMVGDIVPKHGKYSDIHLETKAATYTVEPSTEAVFNALFPLLIRIMLYHALLESKASEHSARMVAMKNATDKAKEVGKTLTLTYNKVRQAVITREVSEITGGIEAMKQ
jgi:F-type H+-transporting ATPase subunit gamma